MVDGNTVRARLSARSDVEPTAKGFVWVDHAGRPGSGGGPLGLGTVEVGDAQLVLRTHSRERLERGKILLGDTLGAAVRHRQDGTREFAEALRESRERPPAAAPDPIPPEVRAEVIREFLTPSAGRAMHLAGGEKERPGTARARLKGPGRW